MDKYDMQRTALLSLVGGALSAFFFRKSSPALGFLGGAAVGAIASTTMSSAEASPKKSKALADDGLADPFHPAKGRTAKKSEDLADDGLADPFHPAKGKTPKKAKALADDGLADPFHPDK